MLSVCRSVGRSVGRNQSVGKQSVTRKGKNVIPVGRDVKEGSQGLDKYRKLPRP